MTDFVKTLIELRNGAVALEGSEKLTEVLKAVMETGKKGKLALAIEITPSKVSFGRGVTEVELVAKYVTIEPAHDPAKTTFFTGEDGSLSRDDPNQVAMFAHEHEEKESEAASEPVGNRR